MTRAYNATGHDSSFFFYFLLMFGHSPCLAIDAFLGIPQTTDTIRNHNEYVERLKQRQSRNAAYVITSAIYKNCEQTERIL